MSPPPPPLPRDFHATYNCAGLPDPPSRANTRGKVNPLIGLACVASTKANGSNETTRTYFDSSCPCAANRSNDAPISNLAYQWPLMLREIVYTLLPYMAPTIFSPLPLSLSLSLSLSHSRFTILKSRASHSATGETINISLDVIAQQ
jgi:hypothetical protein